MKRGKYSCISSHEAEQLLKTYGPNEIRNPNKNSALKILMHQIRTNYVIYLLLAALAISFIVGKYETAYTIIAVILIVITVGFIQEYKAEKAIDALKNMITATSVVLRDDKEIEIQTKEIVPGDILILRTGDRIPADCIVLEERELSINESVLTGESKDVKKIAVKTVDAKTIDKHENSIYMGTFITTGKCIAKVIHTGMNTKFGSIANMISTVEKDLPLQSKVNTIVKYIVILGASLSALAGLIMLIEQAPITYGLFVEALIVVLALSIAAFPEGFPVVLITTLAYGSYRMAKKNAIVNRMSIIETLGETTVICSDKTGTITTGSMTAKKIIVDNRMLDVSGAGYSADGEIISKGRKIDIDALSQTSALYRMLHGLVLCNDARIERKGEAKEYNAIGSPTESALLILSAKAGIHREDIRHTRIKEIPFTSERKMMSVLVDEKGSKSAYAKGAPEILLKRCKYIMLNGKKILLRKKESEALLSKVTELTSLSYRAIAVAFKEVRQNDSMEHDLTLLGIVAMEDPPRPEIKESLMVCEAAGIRVKMITGDCRETAQAIAKEIGLIGDTLSGSEIDLMTDDELTKIVSKITIFYRVRPEHKLRIVHALKANGEIVTMTGDGVNDAPALKEAHIGVSMGKNGTDVSREASDLILKDDHFSTIVDAIREGRTIFNNIQKFTVYQISINIAQVMLILLSVLIGLPLPLIAIQILFMNILSDEVTAISLAFNAYSKDVMTQPPRRKSEIITRPLMIFMLIAGILMTIGAVTIFYILIHTLNATIAEARTTVLVAMTLFAIVNAFNFRSFRKLVLTRSIMTNRYLFYASVLSIILTLIVIYTPINATFEIVPIGVREWVLALSFAALLMVIIDLLKIANNRYKIIDRHG